MKIVKENCIQSSALSPSANVTISGSPIPAAERKFDLYWYGYRHIDGSLHVKRYSDFGDIIEASNSDLVDQVCAKFKADSREEAMRKISSIL